MHNYILVDVIEVYENKNKKVTVNDIVNGVDKGIPVGFDVSVELTGHKYLIGCYQCEETRIIHESTFNIMKENGLIEGLGLDGSLGD